MNIVTFMWLVLHGWIVWPEHHVTHGYHWIEWLAYKVW